MGDYDQSMQDFATFKNSKVSEENPLVISAFSAGFAKGLPQGVYESGKGIMVFLSDFVTHPIHTSKQVVESFSRLAELVKKDEWDIIGKSIAPEIYELVQEWDSLPSDRKGELAGYALGKHGTDIIAPGVLTKVASKSLKSAKELATVCKNIKMAEETLCLEVASKVGHSASVGEIINNTKGVLSTKIVKSIRNWPSAADGRQIINGIEYSRHALERMSPYGLIQKGQEMVSRGIPPLVVENVIKMGEKLPGNTANEIIHIFENVRVVTTADGKRVITVITTGR